MQLSASSGSRRRQEREGWMVAAALSEPMPQRRRPLQTACQPRAGMRLKSSPALRPRPVRQLQQVLHLPPSQ